MYMHTMYFDHYSSLTPRGRTPTHLLDHGVQTPGARSRVVPVCQQRCAGLGEQRPGPPRFPPVHTGEAL